eukprot:6204475-Pleurochrysis_carterae.AAC.1
MTGSTVPSNVLDYNIEGHRVCAGTFAAVYSIPLSTLPKLAGNVLKGHQEWVTYNDTKTTQTRRDCPSLLAEATTQLQTRLRYYDIMPHIRRCIIHP